MKRWTLLLPFVVAALIAAGCGGDSSDDSASTADSAATEPGSMKTSDKTTEAGASMSAQGARIKAVDSDYGRVIADGKGEAFYLFDKEKTKKPQCYGPCAEVWPPVLTKGKPMAGKGIKQNLLGTTRRSNGKLQVTYAGHPLYYYVDDSPGTILCHDVPEFGGLWLVVKPDGEAA